MKKLRMAVAALVALAAFAVRAQEVSFKDPVGDDNGPGKYTYPTDPVYKRGSFDLTAFRVVPRGGKADIEVTFNSALEDPWRMGTGFAVQMVFVFVDTKEGGNTQGPPGTNIAFAEDSGWEKMIILSPQSAGRVKNEVGQKMGGMKDAVIIPGRVTGSNRSIKAQVDLKAIGEGDPSKWGWQVVVQSNEGFPAATDLLTRKVNEYEGQHRFGGGTDSDCDPHVMDILAGKGAGTPDEIEEQHKMLAYECEGTEAKKRATLTMVRK